MVKLNFLFFLLLMSISASPVLAAVNITVGGEDEVVIPQGGVGDIHFHISNLIDYGSTDNMYVNVSVSTPTDENGNSTPSEWWEITVYPLQENFTVPGQFWWENNTILANLLVPCGSWVEGEENVPPAEEVQAGGFDTYWGLSTGQFAPAKEVIVEVKPSENVPLGRYQVSVSFTGVPPTAVAGGFGTSTSVTVESYIEVVASPPPPPPLPVWATILLIGALVGIAAGLVHVIRKKKVKI